MSTASLTFPLMMLAGLTLIMVWVQRDRATTSRLDAPLERFSPEEALQKAVEAGERAFRARAATKTATKTLMSLFPADAMQRGLSVLGARLQHPAVNDR
jgi:hypothetical protein